MFNVYFVLFSSFSVVSKLQKLSVSWIHGHKITLEEKCQKQSEIPLIVWIIHILVVKPEFDSFDIFQKKSINNRQSPEW